MAVDGKKMSVSSINFSRTVRAVKLGRLSAIGVSHSNSFLYGAFVWAYTGRLTAKNGGFWPGQSFTRNREVSVL